MELYNRTLTLKDEDITRTLGLFQHLSVRHTQCQRQTDRHTDNVYTQPVYT